MPAIAAALVGIVAAFVFGVAAAVARGVWRRRRGTSLDLTPWYRFGPSITFEEKRSRR